jgi:polysaccharide export outer membrane protein
VNLVKFNARCCCAGLTGLLGWVLLLAMVGCQEPQVSSVEQFVEFQKAGPIRPEVDLKRLVQARTPQYPYTVAAGDVLELHMPVVLQALEVETLPSLDQMQPYLCRVSPQGSINLPIVGPLPVAGKNLSALEAAIVTAYYPRYVVEPPSVVARISEYHTQSVSIVGAVLEPGVYPLNSNELSLVALLMKAGGIVDDGAGVIRIRHAADSQATEPLVLPVKGLNIPFADVALTQGDVVEVEALDPALFTVIGLVNKPGAFPIPPGVDYNLMQALAFAGGMDDMADPQYVRVYRQQADGQIIDATFKIAGSGISNASSVTIKSGDVVAVEQTDRTRTRLLIAEIINFTTGVTLVYRLDEDDIN